MRRRSLSLIALASSLTLLATPAHAITAPVDTAVARTDTTMSVTPVFSPNGDGVRDAAKVRFNLTRATADVTLTVTRLYNYHSKVVRTVHLGDLPAGTHTWRWDGRDWRTRPREGDYLVALSGVVGDRAKELAVRRTSVDTTAYARVSRSATTAYPRTTEVHDIVTLTAFGAEQPPTRIGMAIRDSAGDVVLRRRARTFKFDASGDDDVMSVEWDARDRAGRALAPGRYVATMHTRDAAGNRARDSIVLHVSGKRLVWQNESRTLLAADANKGACSLSTANGCGDLGDCGHLVPSTRFVGGLSHLSGICDDARPDRAASLSWVTFPEAKIRGIEAARLSFTGAPTYDGEQDPGTLRLHGGDGVHSVSSTAGATTPWVSDLDFGQVTRDYGTIGYLPPLVEWWFSTEGDDAFDVASYTVEARYLVVQG